MRSFRPILATLVVLGALVAVVLVSRHRTPAPAAGSPTDTPAPTAVPGRLVLFFPGDDALLHREAREVPEMPPLGAPRVRLVVEELAAGSREGFATPFPWGAAVQAVFLDRAGNAYVDLSAPPADAVAGTDGELAVAYATTDSVVANCPGVEQVQLLFGGRQVVTLGHLDFSRPFRPRLELVAP